MPSNSSEQGTSLPYRAWSICCIAKTRELFERHFHRALREAAAHGINRLELLDYYIPWVNYGITYRAFPKLTTCDTLYTGDGHVPKRASWSKVKDLDYPQAAPYIKDTFRKVKDAGLALNVWYHTGRDVPPELFRLYPEYASVDSGFLYEFEKQCLAEFFELYPEVDGLVVTSIHETASILEQEGATQRRDRLAGLYQAIHDTCRKAGKDFILRDFIVKQSDFEDFQNVLDKLPDDVIVMTKEILADWCFTHQELNPLLVKYRDRRLVIEFDLYGEYQGRSELPYPDPDYFYKALRQMLPYGIEGAVGRLVHEFDRDTEFPTIFDSCNAINVDAFSRTLNNVGPTLESLGEWAHTMYTDPGLKLWVPWITRRFGKESVVDVLPILRACSDLLTRTMNVCGFNLQWNSRLLSPAIQRGGFNRRRFDPIHPEGVLETWIRNEPLAMDLMRTEKDDLVADTRAWLERTRRVAAGRDSDAMNMLVRSMENLHWVAQASRSISLLYAGGLLAPDSADTEALRKDADTLANHMESARDATFYWKLPATLREWVSRDWC